MYTFEGVKYAKPRAWKESAGQAQNKIPTVTLKGAAG